MEKAQPFFKLLPLFMQMSRLEQGTSLDEPLLGEKTLVNEMNTKMIFKIFY